MIISYTSAMLRRELNARGREFARTHKLIHDVAPRDQVIIFGRDDAGRHGNFHPDSYSAICANADWLRRLTKVHTGWKRSRVRADWPWMELDTAASSDALLMNIFCYPEVFKGDRLAPSIASLLGIPVASRPCFGIHPRIPLKPNSRGRALTDRTEIDLQIGDLLIEAKLTETSFQNARFALIDRYRDLESVFDISRLPRVAELSGPDPIDIYPDDEPNYDESRPVEDYSRTIPIVTRPEIRRSSSPGGERFQSHQLIRNVLAAFHSNSSFSVLCDARRQDLIEAWHAVMSAVHHPEFTWRLKLLTWQELTSALPAELQEFLAAKYGILPM